ncbi:N-formylglutamate amidohydrolase [Sinirhodobacter ferrireducens]|uniref:N-formylglutamate amidohydrolase n=1 Tax=Paenirhodobacter ferrireducens TaxID=1215032 RepID=A0A443LCF7_9RHOB|nr:N-formylglutamate amidohydrolase [Sinirhodobacter ferrireducens]RWR46795.1 N-formylglutamate amidohydrolase [Sinirhodobacter ferrireducens]
MAVQLCETEVYRLWTPERMTTAVIFASPHSGRDYPPEMLARSVLDLQRLRSSEDAFVDRFLEGAPREGAAALSARLPRAWVDLNRDETELDPALIEGLGRGAAGPRVQAGLGVIPRVVSANRAIYSGKLTRDEAERRIATVWRPYHATLAALLREVRARFGRAILIDMHSMPSEAVSGAGPRPAEVVLGDRYGAAARPDTVAAVETIFARLGLRVARNAPFAGAYVTQHYGRPASGYEVIQVEISRGLYMDEAAIRPSAGYEDFRALMARAVAGIAAIGRESTTAHGSLAAE